MARRKPCPRPECHCRRSPCAGATEAASNAGPSSEAIRFQPTRSLPAVSWRTDWGRRKRVYQERESRSEFIRHREFWSDALHLVMRNSAPDSIYQFGGCSLVVGHPAPQRLSQILEQPVCGAGHARTPWLCPNWRGTLHGPELYFSLKWSPST